MSPFYLVEIQTKDKLIHQGIFFKPKQPKKKAILWVHGLTGSFYDDSHLMHTFAENCQKLDWGFAAFNNRGHDLLVSIKKVDRRKPKGYYSISIGSSREIFTESVFDIEAQIDFLVKQGFTKVILIGHSTGANKVCYFAAIKSHPNVISVVLASPVSDRLDPSLAKEKLSQDLENMRKLVKTGKGNEVYFGHNYLPMTPKRFLRLLSPNSLEDQFDYGNTNPKLTYFSKIKLPLLVILGSTDEYLDRPAKDVLTVFDQKTKSRNYKSLLIPKALHGYNGMEEEVVSSICDWIKTL